ncbi:MAG: capsule assembly Wzi family protein [Gemmatimonadota bacterium]
MRFLVSGLAAALCVSSTAAQRPPVTPVLAHDHWSVAALRRLETALPAAARDAGASSLTHDDAIDRFRALAANTIRPEFAARAAVYLERFLEEFPLAQTNQFYARNATAGFLNAKGRAGPGAGFIRDEDWTGALPLPALNTTYAALEAGGSLNPIAAQLSIAYDGDWSWDETHALLQWRNVELWGGRRAIRFGPAESGFVLSGNAQFNGGGFQLARPVFLPSLLRHLGPFDFETFASRLEQNGLRKQPWFWGARFSIQPIPTLTLGLNRASIFAGEGQDASILNLLEMFAGGYGGESGEFENQVVSADAHLAIRGKQPLELYVEWAADDASGMWQKAPAITLGAIAGWPAAFAAIERAVMYPRPKCCNTYWYRNTFFRGSWSKDDVPLGHELGGHGTQTSLRFGVEALEARFRMTGHLVMRDRGEENLYAPEREGRSYGFEAKGFLRFQRTQAEWSGQFEDGNGWQSHQYRIGLRAYF